METKKMIVEDIHGNIIEAIESIQEPLTEEQIREHINSTPKIDVEALLRQGYRKLEDVCKEIENTKNMCPRVEEHWFQQFKGITFKFFGKDGIGIVLSILFTFEKVTQLSPDKTILVGTVTYDNQSINGDRIVINFNKGTVKYKARGKRYQYSLEIDNRTKPSWDTLLEQLQITLNARQ